MIPFPTDAYFTTPSIITSVSFAAAIASAIVIAPGVGSNAIGAVTSS
jgi:hypothetical protein